jgi:hypothetical protein
MTYEYSSGSMWQGLLADGTFDSEKLNKKYIMCYGHHIDGDIDIADLIYRMHKDGQSKICSEYNDTDNRDLNCFCSRLRNPQTITPLCETYVLSANEKLHDTAAIPSHPYTSAIIEELIGAEPNRHVVIMLSNCTNLIECKKTVLFDLGFMPRDKEEYQNYKKFSTAARKLIDKSIKFFEAPCCKLFEHLEQQGFTGEHVTYP